MVPKFNPKNQRPELILKDLEWLLCPVQVLGLYVIRSADQAKENPHQKLFVHFSPKIQLFITHFRRWLAETIRLTYESVWVQSS